MLDPLRNNMRKKTILPVFIALVALLFAAITVVNKTPQSKHEPLGGDPYCTVVGVDDGMKERVWVSGSEVHRIVKTASGTFLLIDHMSTCADPNYNWAVP